MPDNFEPLSVTCMAFNEIATDGYLPLDAILAALWMRERHPNEFYNNSVAAKDELIEAELPIQRVDHGHGWYYACSFAQTKWSGGSVRYWHKRNTASEQIRYVRKGKLDLSQGKTKAYRMPLFTLRAGDTLTWYLVGDRAWLAARLPLVTGLGKKRDVGNGIVCRWRVEPVAEDWSIVKDGALARAVPVEDLPGAFEYREGFYGLRPPYWHRDQQARGALPVLRESDEVTDDSSVA